MERDERKLEKLLKLVEELNHESLGETDILPIIDTLTKIIESIDSRVSSKIEAFEGNLEAINAKCEGVYSQAGTSYERLMKTVELLKEKIDIFEQEYENDEESHELYMEGIEEELEKISWVALLDKKQIETLKTIKPNSPKDIRDSLQTLTGDERLSASAIKDLPQFFERVVEKGGNGFIETPIKAGSNITVSKDAFGAWVITASASGYQEPTSGTVNGNNRSFVFTTAPNVLVVDGLSIRKVSSDGTVNWTGTTSITLEVAPNYDMFAIA